VSDGSYTPSQKVATEYSGPIIITMRKSNADWYALLLTGVAKAVGE